MANSAAAAEHAGMAIAIAAWEALDVLDDELEVYMERFLIIWTNTISIYRKRSSRFLQLASMQTLCYLDQPTWSFSCKIYAL